MGVEVTSPAALGWIEMVGRGGRVTISVQRLGRQSTVGMDKTGHECLWGREVKPGREGQNTSNRYGIHE